MGKKTRLTKINIGNKISQGLVNREGVINMRSSVRDSSIESNYRRHAIDINTGQTERIAAYVKGKTWVTRRMIAQALDIETATISGRVKPMVLSGVLIETTERMPCPITGNRVHWLQHRDNARGQINLI